MSLTRVFPLRRGPSNRQLFPSPLDVVPFSRLKSDKRASGSTRVLSLSFGRVSRLGRARARRHARFCSSRQATKSGGNGEGTKCDLDGDDGVGGTGTDLRGVAWPLVRGRVVIFLADRVGDSGTESYRSAASEVVGDEGCASSPPKLGRFRGGDLFFADGGGFLGVASDSSSSSVVTTGALLNIADFLADLGVPNSGRLIIDDNLGVGRATPLRRPRFIADF